MSSGASVADSTRPPVNAQVRNYGDHRAWSATPMSAITDGGAGWWQDNAILGRLSALSRRFSAVKLIATPLQAWREFTAERKPKRDLQFKREIALKLRLWQLRVRWRRYRPELLLLRAVTRPAQRALRVAWDRLRGLPSPELKRKLRRLKLAKVVHGRVLQGISTCQYARSLLRRALGSFWIATASGRSRGALGSKRGRRASLSEAALDDLDHGPQTVLVQLQHKCWQRWYRNTMMHLGPLEFEQEQRKARILLLMRDRTRSAIAMNFRVWRLLHRSFEAFVINVDGDEATAFAAATAAAAAAASAGSDMKDRASGDILLRQRRRSGSISSGVGTEDGTRGPARPAREVSSVSSRARAPRNSRARAAALAEAQRGLRGTSTGEVLRKGWRRWCFAAVTVDAWVPSAKDRRRPSGMETSLLRIASEVEETRRLNRSVSSQAEVRGAGASVPLDSSRSNAGASTTAASSMALGNFTMADAGIESDGADLRLPINKLSSSRQRPMRAAPDSNAAAASPEAEPPHLALLQRALESFDRINSKTPPRRADRGDQPMSNGALAAAASPDGPWGLGALPGSAPPVSVGGSSLRRGQEMALSMPSLLSTGLPAPPLAAAATSPGPAAFAAASSAPGPSGSMLLAGWPISAGHDGRAPSASSESRSPSALRRARLRSMEERPDNSGLMQYEQEFGFDSAEPLHLWQSGSGEGEVAGGGVARPSASPPSSAMAFTPARRRDDAGSMDGSSFRDGGVGSSSARRKTAPANMVESSGTEYRRSFDGSLGPANDAADSTAFVLSAQPAGASPWEDYGSRRRGKRAVEALRAPPLRQ